MEGSFLTPKGKGDPLPLYIPILPGPEGCSPTTRSPPRALQRIWGSAAGWEAASLPKPLFSHPPLTPTDVLLCLSLLGATFPHHIPARGWGPAALPGCAAAP